MILVSQEYSSETAGVTGASPRLLSSPSDGFGDGGVADVIGVANTDYVWSDFSAAAFASSSSSSLSNQILSASASQPFPTSVETPFTYSIQAGDSSFRWCRLLGLSPPNSQPHRRSLISALRMRLPDYFVVERPPPADLSFVITWCRHKSAFTLPLGVRHERQRFREDAAR